MDDSMLKKVVLWFFMIIFTFLILLTNYNIFLYIIFSIFIVILAVALTNLDITHPLCWFIPIFTLYQIAYPWLKLIGIDVYTFQNINNNYVILNWFALLLMISLMLNIKKVNYNLEKITKKINLSLIRIIYIFIIIVSTIGVFYIKSRGFINKYDLANSNNLTINFFNIIINSISIISIFYSLVSNISNKKKIIIFITSSIVLVLAMGITGERDLIIKHLIMYFIYYYILFKPTKRKMIRFGIILIFLLTISSSFKMFLVRNNEFNLSSKNYIESFLTSDFQSAGFNFNYLLNHNTDFSLKNGSTLLYDIISPIRKIVGVDYHNISTQWYQQTFWNTRRTGLGFTFLGEGYINFGIMGIYIWCIIIYYIIKIMYKNSNKSIYRFTAFITFCPMCMYIMRADFANLISPFVKYVLLILIILYFLCNKYKEKEL